MRKYDKKRSLQRAVSEFWDRVDEVAQKAKKKEWDDAAPEWTVLQFEDLLRHLKWKLEETRGEG